MAQLPESTRGGLEGDDFVVGPSRKPSRKPARKPAASTGPGDPPGLRAGSVGAAGLLAQALGAASPEVAASSVTISAVLLAGAAAPAAFLLGGVAVACLAIMLAYLSRHFTTSGGIAGLVEATLGPRSGMLTGWACLIGLGFAAGILVLLSGGFAGLFFGLVLPHVSWLSSSWVPWSAAVGVLVVALSVLGVRPSVAVLFLVSLAGISAITILAIAVLTKGGAHGVAWGSLIPGHVKGASTDRMLLAIGAVTIGFSGFESATSLAEEATRPRRQIPVVLLSVVGATWIFFVLVSLSMISGFGTSSSGINTIVNLQAFTFVALSGTFLTAWFGHMLIGMIAVSCFGGALGLFNEMSRMLWSLAREGNLPRVMARTTRRSRSPWVAVLVLAAVAAVELVASGVWKGTAPLDISVPATWLSLVIAPGLLVAYLLAAAGGAVLAHKHAAPWPVRFLCPAVVVGIFGLTLYHQFVPLQTGTYKAAPFVGLAILVVGGVVAWLAARTPQAAQDPVAAFFAADGVPTAPAVGTGIALEG